MKRCHKLNRPWIGRWRNIKEICDGTVYRIQRVYSASSNRPRKVVHYNYLKPYLQPVPVVSDSEPSRGKHLRVEEEPESLLLTDELSSGNEIEAGSQLERSQNVEEPSQVEPDSGQTQPAVEFENTNYEEEMSHSQNDEIQEAGIKDVETQTALKERVTRFGRKIRAN